MDTLPESSPSRNRAQFYLTDGPNPGLSWLTKCLLGMNPEPQLKVTVWGINYHPEQIGIGLYSTQMCEFLAEQGHQVTVVTGYPYYPQWKPFQNITHVFQQDRRNKVVIQRTWHFIPSRPGAFNRILHELSFVLVSFVRQLTLPAPDFYIVVSPPLLLGAFALLLCFLKRSKYVFHVQDLQPDAALALGMLRPGIFVSAVRVIEWLAYKGAFLVSSISSEMCRLIKDRCQADKVILFPNWIEEMSAEQGPSWRKSMQISEDKKIVAYSGNLGKKQGLGLIAELAEVARDCPDLVFLVGGAGPYLELLSTECKRRNLTNMVFQGLLDEAMHTQMLREIDLFLIPQQAGSGNFLFPSKLLKVLAVGCPVVTNSEEGSALTRVLSSNDCGVVLPNATAEQMKEAIIALLADHQRLAQLKRNGHSYASSLRKECVLDAFLDLVGKHIVTGQKAQIKMNE